ncbi:MAG: matrix metalloproteinase-11, partial [Actinobacteria bacterium]|nr:matrix metalloproteinase-11 [Actinomycetota bacterium]
EENRVLRWRFNTNSLSPFAHPTAIAEAIRDLLGEAVMAWGDAVPIRFDENPDNSDFEIVVQELPDCSPQGCVLAQAFFPDSGRHQLLIFPTMFEQIRAEQVETLAHEIGHVFGLRHFFAPEMETSWPAEVFGEHTPFSIMNYGENSKLTDADRRDLKLLYGSVWNGQLKKINGTPIKLVRPYHYSF